MVVPSVVDAIAGVEVENDAPVSGMKLRTLAAFIGDIHLQNVEQAHPLRVDVTLVKIFVAFVEARGLKHGKHLSGYGVYRISSNERCSYESCLCLIAK